MCAGKKNKIGGQNSNAGDRNNRERLMESTVNVQQVFKSKRKERGIGLVFCSTWIIQSVSLAYIPKVLFHWR